MSFKLTVLGSGSALPTSKRFPSAHVLNVHEHFYLIDCGEGTQHQIRKYRISFNKINHIFISHLHGDHYFGLFGLLSTMSLLGREGDLHLFCPPDLRKILGFMFQHIGLEFKILFHTLEDTPQIIFETKSLAVHALPLKHSIPTWGFVFKEKQKQRNIRKDQIDFLKLTVKEIVDIKNGADYKTDAGITIPNRFLTLPLIKPRSYAYISDTGYLEAIIPHILNIDLLYHEATFDNAMQQFATEKLHSTATEAGKIALKANVKKLLIGHFSSRYTDSNQMLQEAKAMFPETYAVEDGDSFEVASERIDS